jgi:hypothetical protein
MSTPFDAVTFIHGPAMKNRFGVPADQSAEQFRRDALR